MDEKIAELEARIKKLEDKNEMLCSFAKALFSVLSHDANALKHYTGEEIRRKFYSILGNQ